MGKRFRQLTQTATDADFVEGNYFGVDTPSVTKKVPVNLVAKASEQAALTTYAQNVAHSIAPEFDPTRASSRPYLVDERVSYGGVIYTFKNNHYGAWDANDVYVQSDNEITGYIDSKKIDGDVGKNLFDKNSKNKQTDAYVGYASGKLFEASGMSCVVIPISSSEISVNKNNVNIAAFAGVPLLYEQKYNKQISGYLGGFLSSTNNRSWTIPSGCKAIIVGYYSSYEDTLQVEKGSSSTNYESYKFGLKKEKVFGLVGFIDKIKTLLFKKIPASADVPVVRSTKNLFSKDMVGNFAVDRWTGNIISANNISQYKAAAVKLEPGDYVISGYGLFDQWTIALYSLDFLDMYALRSDVATIDPDSVISIPSGEEWGSASQINVSVDKNCVLLINLLNWDSKWYNSVLQIESGNSPTSYKEGVKFFPNYAQLGEVQYLSNKLLNKRILIIGDSITDMGYYTTSLVNITGCYVYNRGVSGSCICKRSSTIATNSFVERFDLEENNGTEHNVGFPSIDNIDMVVVFGGTNDWGNSRQLGEIDAEIDRSKFYGALRYLLSGLKTRYYRKPIVMLSLMNAARSTIFANWNRVTFNENGSFVERTNNAGLKMSDYRDASKAVCELLGVHFVDMFTCGFSPLNQYDYENLCYIQGNPAVPDGLHPNEAGGEIIARFLNGKLNALM